MRIGFDIGTAVTTVVTSSGGIVYREPSAVVIDCHTGDILAMGDRAYPMIGRLPSSRTVVYPVRDGVVSNVAILEKMLSEIIRDNLHLGLLRPDVVACVSGAIKETEKQALEGVFKSLGARDVAFVSAPKAAAIGCGVDRSQQSGTLVINIGAGSTDMAVIAGGEICEMRSLRFGSGRLDDDIINYLKNTRDISIGELTAEKIKRRIGGAILRREEVSLLLSGKNVITYDFTPFEVTSSEVYSAMGATLRAFLQNLTDTLSSCTPELSCDVLENGIVLTGGGARLYGMKSFLEAGTGIRVCVAENPHLACAFGVLECLRGRA